jgi:hypothetical protein
MVLAREQELLSVLSQHEKQQLIESMNKLSLQSRSILEKE